MYTDSLSLRPKKLIAKGQIKRVSTRKEMEHGGKEERGEKENLSEAQNEEDTRRMVLGWKSLLFPPPPLVFLFFLNATEKAHAVMKTWILEAHPPPIIISSPSG